MKQKSTVSAVATFGAVAATMYISPSAEAGIINLTPLPQTNSYSTGTATDPNIFNVGVLPGGIFSNIASDFGQFNDDYGASFQGGSYDINFWRFASASDTISTGDTFSNFLSVAASLTGTQFFGFETIGGLVGWLKVDFGQTATSDITYVAGAYESMETSIRVGALADNNSVPEPATLGLTALGLLAAGARGKRRKAKVTH
tara:strand:+ start:259 stop:861 length:603 start_codon:yes stop_codon:yes gene_type:complete